MLSNEALETKSTPTIASRLTGTFVGGWTGGIAGVRRSHQMCKKLANLYPVGPLIYVIGVVGCTIVTAPFHGIRGARVGATEGLTASTKYPSIVENKHNGTEIQKHLAELQNKYTQTEILTSREEQDFSLYLEVYSSFHSTYEEKSIAELQLKFKLYLEYTKKIKGTKKPVYVLGEVREFDDYKKFVDEAREHGDSIGCYKENISIHPPDNIAGFIKEARQRLCDVAPLLQEVIRNKKSSSTKNVTDIFAAHLSTPSVFFSDDKLTPAILPPPPTNPHVNLNATQYPPLFTHTVITPSAPSINEVNIIAKP